MISLTTGVLSETAEPYGLFAAWMEEARASEPNDANAMALATVDAEGLPDVRMVLLKGVDDRGFVFYTNAGSAKGGELADCPKAAAVFHWKSLRRQVRVRGPVEPVASDEADAYFATRHRDSRIGAWASRQSRPLGSKEQLEADVARETARFAGGEVPRPPYWNGYRIVPVAMEFWHDRSYRLHERIRFVPEGERWTGTRLYP